ERHRRSSQRRLRQILADDAVVFAVFVVRLFPVWVTRLVAFALRITLVMVMAAQTGRTSLSTWPLRRVRVRMQRQRQTARQQIGGSEGSGKWSQERPHGVSDRCDGVTNSEHADCTGKFGPCRDVSTARRLKPRSNLQRQMI